MGGVSGGWFTEAKDFMPSLVSQAERPPTARGMATAVIRLLQLISLVFISKYFVVIASMIMMLAALRASAYKSTTMGLLSSSVVVVAFALSLLVVGDMYDISFFKDISLALVLFGFIGTVAFAVTQGGDD